MSKGSKQRPVNQKKFDANYDTIFGKDLPPPTVRKGTHAKPSITHVDKKKESKINPQMELDYD